MTSLNIYYENNNIKDIDLESNFLQNSISSVCPNKLAEPKKYYLTKGISKAIIYRFNKYLEP